jgi:hypothetical protein
METNVSADDLFSLFAILERSERPFLSRSKARERSACSALRNLDLNGGRVGRVHFGRTQQRVLREDFAINLGHEIILAVFVVAPDLSELDGLYCHWSALNFVDSIPDYREALRASIALLGYERTKMQNYVVARAADVNLLTFTVHFSGSEYGSRRCSTPAR